MAKKRNKGFSLIEVIIGVAILTILLTPVIKQLVQTLNTNRRAKEQQYANESATNVLEYAQKTSFEDLKKVGTSGDIYVTDYQEKQRECEIYIYDKTTGDIKSIDDYSKVSGNKITYNVNTYKLNSVELGSKRTKYLRTLLLDDLANKIASYEFEDKTVIGKKNGLRVAYDPSEAIDISGIKSQGYQYTSEGSVVKYSEDGSDTYVSGILCTLNQADKIIDDPNESTVGSMLNLEASQVALVNGDSTNYDKQAQDDLYAMAVAYVKENYPERYEQILNGGDPLKEANYLNGLAKTTTIKITKGKDGSKPYYLVKVDVAYKNDVNIRLEYNVFSQKFYYKDKDAEGNTIDAPTVPAVYIEYQPFSVTDSGASVGYTADEYIMVDNSVDGAKIYLYKPMKNMSYIKKNQTTDVNAVIDKNPDGESYYQSDYATHKVKIHINSVENTDNVKAGTYIFTNLVKRDSAHPELAGSIDNNQFSTAKIGDAKSAFEGTYTTFDQIFLDGKDKDQNGKKEDATKRRLYLQDINLDKNKVERLYTATVIVEPETASANTVKLTGAKGGQ